MNKKEIKSVWAAFLEVQEAKKKALDPVGKEDGDVDNDGDEDSSDEYLANRRKKVGAAVKKEGTLPPALQKAIDKKKGKKTDDDDSDDKDSGDKESDDKESDEKSKKPEKGVNPFAKKDKKDDVKESEESPYPSLDKKKREKKGSNLEDAGGPAAKLKGEAVESDKEECPKCNGKGCEHCDDKGYHSKKESVNFDLFSLEELEALAEKMQPNSSGTKSEPFMSTSSAGEKKFFADHEKGSEKKYEDWEETGEKDASDAGKAVKSQSPTRRGEKRQSETMSKVK